MRTNESISVRPYTNKELARLYQVSTGILRGWLKLHAKAIGPKHGWYFTALQVRIIFERLGEPGE